MTQALLTCPFCGTTEHLVISACGSLTADMPDRPHRVLCTHIDHDTVEGPVGYGQLAAILAWNTRAKEQSHSPTETAGLRETLEGIERIAEKHTGISGARSLQTAMHAIAHAARAAIATLSPNGVSQSAVEERIARLSLDVGRLLAADPICGGRVSGGTVQAIAALATQPASDMELLEWLTGNQALELTCAPVEGDLSEVEWQVHRGNGGYNDREWSLISSGLTPVDALRQARTTLEATSDEGGPK